MENQEFEEWQKDIKQSDGTGVRSFANGPFVRSLFRTCQHIDGVIQQMRYLTNAVRNVNESLEILSNKIENFNETTSNLTKKANKLITWYVVLTGIITIATVINIFK